MEHLIDKDALVAEINRLIDELVKEGEDTMFEQGRISAFEDIKVFINNTLEVERCGKYVSNDLNIAAREYSLIEGAENIDEYAQYDLKKYNSFKDGAKWQKERIELSLKAQKEV